MDIEKSFKKYYEITHCDKTASSILVLAEAILELSHSTKVTTLGIPSALHEIARSIGGESGTI